MCVCVADSGHCIVPYGNHSASLNAMHSYTHQMLTRAQHGTRSTVHRTAHHTAHSSVHRERRKVRYTEYGTQRGTQNCTQLGTKNGTVKPVKLGLFYRGKPVKLGPSETWTLYNTVDCLQRHLLHVSPTFASPAFNIWQ